MKWKSAFYGLVLVITFTGIAVIFSSFIPIDKDSSSAEKIEQKNEVASETFSPKFNLKEIEEKILGEDDGKDLVLVTKVIDGDTIEIEGGTRVRYIGIDTPETVDPRKTVQCFGREASNKNKDLVEGKKVRLEKDITNTDKYDRLLRYVWINNELVNETLVKEGFAYSSPYPPDVKYQDWLNKAQSYSQSRNLGLWSSCNVAGIENSQPQTQSESNSCQIKGNISGSGEKIYHVPGQRYYNNTVVNEFKGERWFCTEKEAQDAG